MSRLLKSLEPLSQYKDRKFEGSLEEYVACLRRSTTVYVGNLAFHTTEEQIYALFTKCGPLRRIIMGLDKNQMTPCGFCFVEYCSRRDTEECVKYLNGSRLDERDVRIDFDWGFQEGRQFGRGKHGGQVRDEYRTDYDVGRGGYGKLVQSGLSELQQRPGAREGAPLLPPPVAPQQQPWQAKGGEDDGRGRKRGRDSEDDEARDKRARENTAEKNPRFRGERRDDDDDDAA